MKKVGLIVSIILLTGVITFSLLTRRPSSNVQLVKFKGVENVTNITKGHFDWLSTNEYVDRMNAIPAQENDLIYGLQSSGEERFFVLQLKKHTDKVLNVRFDSLGAFIDDRLATLVWDENESAVYKWLSQSTKEDFQQLQSVYISDSLTENNLQELRKIGKYTSGVGLLVDSDFGNIDVLQEVLKPTWLWLSNVNLTPRGIESFNKMDNLESLILADVNMDKITLDGLKKLRMLHIDSPDTLIPAQLNKLPKKLTTLQVSNSDISDLNFLDGNAQLKELTFNHCSLLRDISALKKLSHLTALSLANCDSIPDLTPLNGLKNLKWFAPPKNISEQQLASIINTSPNLQSLVLVDCQQIKSLKLLNDFHQLSFLTLVSTPIEPDSLVRFKNLKYLAYGNSESSDSLSLARLQKEMPNTLVTAAEPFCMGTGWLIVFFVMVMVLVMVGIKVRSRIQA